MITEVRNSLNKFGYKYLIKPILFQFDPEAVHKLFIKTGKILGSTAFTREITSIMFNYSNPMLKQRILNIDFKNPIGLSAGFDKDAELTKIIPKVGFGYEEVGSITANSCAGNSGVRIKRIPEKKSLWINLGLNNNGADEIASRLYLRRFEIPIAISIAKTNCKETVDPKIAIQDYLYTLKKMNEKGIGKFFVINISCPNAYGGQPFSNPRLFKMLMYEIYKLNIKKPIFIKISPDLSNENIDKIIEISKNYGVSGFICSNLTKQHKFDSGGLSGKVLEEKSNKLIEYVYKKTKGKFIIIGVGGVFSAKDAYKKIKLGASLISLISGMIYEGPSLISEINRNLVKLLKKDGFSNITEAIGKDVK